MCLPLRSGTDPVEETEAKSSSGRPGLESPELEARKQDFCKGEELRRSNMTPECDDRLKASLQPAIIFCKNTDKLEVNCTSSIHETCLIIRNMAKSNNQITEAIF